MRAPLVLRQASSVARLRQNLQSRTSKVTLHSRRPRLFASMPPKAKNQKTLDETLLGRKPSANNKRKASTELEDSRKSPKKKEIKSENPNVDSTGWPRLPNARGDEPIEERVGIVDRRFYPRQMNAARCQEYMNGTRPRPIEELERAIRETADARGAIEVKDAVVHWFKCDTRTVDNHALHLASEKAKSKGVPLIAVYVVSPQDFEAHATAPIRIDFIMRNLEVLRDDLAELDIPLHVTVVEKRHQIPQKLLDMCEGWRAAHLFANMEYEPDELRREVKLIRQGVKRNIDVTVVHDTCVVPPGLVASGKGTQYAVYTPFKKAWYTYIHNHANILNSYPRPSKNPSNTRKKFQSLFNAKIPDPFEHSLLEGKRLSKDEKERFEKYYPAGEQEALHRLKNFVKMRIGKYRDLRDMPAEASTSHLSCHLAAGTISARTVVAAAREANTSKKLDEGKKGIITWVSEVAWRDFYKHVMVHWAYVSFNVPFKPEYNDIKWDYDKDKFDRWAEGRTGFPIVDAAMRQMNRTGYMHNRCRMIVASFLCKDLLQDWRLGERHFMSHLIDGDFASNNGGWGFCSSAGVDPNPYFRIFNPTLQSGKFDPQGEYIKKWIPELSEINGTQIHDPYNRGADSIAKQGGYPRPMVDHKEMRGKALQMYKQGLGRETT